jgi:DNA-binding transcriptional LysR family regulator
VLNIQRLLVLRTVITEGSVTAAAGLLSYSPSAVSQQIAVLEREVGVPLLERVGRRVRPTAAGALLSERAAAILEQVEDAEAALAALVEGRIGRLRIVSFASAGTGLVPPAIAHVRARHPDADIELTFAEDFPGLQALQVDLADVAIVIRDVARAGRTEPPDPQGDGLDWRLTLLDPYFAALPPGHPLADEAEITFEQLAGERLVSGDRAPYCPCYEAIVEACATAGFRPDFAVEVNNYPAVQSLVAAGVGIGLIPVLGLSPAIHDDIVIRPLAEPVLTRRIYAVTRAGRGEEPLVASLLGGLRDAAGRVEVPVYA